MLQTFTGPYVYQLQSAMCEQDLRWLLRSMGYTRSEQETQYTVAREAPPAGSQHLRQLAFELLLAQAECRLLAEVVALSRGAANELEALELRKASREDAAGCAEALRRRDSLTPIDLSRLSLRPIETVERAATPHHHIHHHHQLRRSSRPSKSVDVTDSAGHWHPAGSKPVLRTSLSLRKEPLFVDAEEEEARDEILTRSNVVPTATLFSLASTPSYSPSSSSSSITASVVASAADFFPIQSPPPPSEPSYSSYHLSSLDEVDLYTERGGGRQTPSSASSSRPPSREPRDGWLLKAHGGAKCQGCGLGCSVLSSCQHCDTVLCSSCLACEPTPCCGYQDYPIPNHKATTTVPPQLSRPLDGYLPAKEKLSVYSNAHTHSHPHMHTHPHAHHVLPLTHAHMHPHPHPHPLSHTHSQLLDKPPLGSTKLYPSKPVAMVTTSGGPAGVSVGERLSSIGGSSSRCGFCNKPGAAHTCVNCSKVSCDSCMGLYGGDACTRKTPHHSFLPNHQLNYKSSTISHLVYR